MYINVLLTNYIFIYYSLFIYNANGYIFGFNAQKLFQVVKIIKRQNILKLTKVSFSNVMPSLQHSFIIYRYFPIGPSIKDTRVDGINRIVMKSLFNDPDLYEQWYFMKQNSSNILSHDLEGLWKLGITGSGVKVGIISSGIQEDHKDLKRNYNKILSHNFINDSRSIYPDLLDSGTKIAGLIAAVANNSKCGVGAAPLALFSILQIFDNETTSASENEISKALSYHCRVFHIYSVFFSTNYDLELSQSIGSASILSLKIGSKFGRGGLGNLYLMTSGDSRLQDNNCGFRGYNQRREIFVIAPILSNKHVTTYSERCTSVLAAAIGTELGMTESLLYSTGNNNQCNKSIGGSAASLAIASGILALLIGENKHLTVRQIFYSLVLSSKQYDNLAICNSVGFCYSYSIGFGMIDANELIKVSKNDTIKHLKVERICSSDFFSGNFIIKKKENQILYLYLRACLFTEECVDHIEELYLTFTLTTKRRNSVTMFLTSPSGTTFRIIEPRAFDTSKLGFKKWRLKILGYFGERPHGLWALEVQSDKYPSYLKMVHFTFYGTCDDHISERNYTVQTDQSVCDKFSGTRFERCHRFLAYCVTCWIPDNAWETDSFYGQDFPSSRDNFPLI